MVSSLNQVYFQPHTVINLVSKAGLEAPKIQARQTIR